MESFRSSTASIFLSLPPSVFTAIFLLLAFSIYRLTVRYQEQRKLEAFGRQHGCLPAASKLPYNWPLAIDVLKNGFGAAREKKLVAFITNYVRDMHSTAEICLLGGKGYVTFDPRNIEALLSTQFEDFHLGTRSWGMHAMIGNGIFTQDGNEWKNSRDILRRRFARMQYQNLKGFQEHMEALVSRLKSSPPGVIDLQKDFYRLTMDTTIAMIIGQSVESFKGETGAHFSAAFDEASRVTGTRVRLGDLYYIYQPRGFFKACRTIRDYTYSFVSEALDGSAKDSKMLGESEAGSFIQDLHDDKPDVGLVRDQVLNILIAGRDTTAAAMSYTFLLLLRHPNTFEKLRQEIETVVGKETNITRAHIQSMSYLQNVLKETLRLYPSAPINSRFCRYTTTLPFGGGTDGQSPLLVPKGLPVAYSVYHMQRRQDIYGEDALCFRPERWEEKDLADIGWAYLPFNGGPRVCLGKDFALMLASYGIVRVMQEFPTMKLASWEETNEPATDRHNLAITMSAADGCKVVLR